MKALQTLVISAVSLSFAIGFDARAAIAADTASKPDADALAALNRMGEALRGMGAFTIDADMTSDIVLDSGQKIQTQGTLKIEARRPDRFRIHINADHVERELIYDGKSITLFAPRIGYYASAPAPATIRETVDVAKTRYGVEIPLADLFSLGVDPVLTARIQSGFDVGPETVAGAACEHYAFRQKSVDWEVWIRSEGPALPCKMIITTTDDPSLPQFSATLKWAAGSPLAESFTFVPPQDAHRITVADLSKSAGK